MFEPGASVFSAAVVRFFVMDPLGNAPLFLSLLKDFEPRMLVNGFRAILGG